MCELNDDITPEMIEAGRRIIKSFKIPLIMQKT